ncbi:MULTISPECIES: AAA family ATPase [unclassified Clostridium]|uniref:AAA family ATPase n=1 Tax=unclassified Clostridium TaxID=2614128 RepID=UPI000297AA19|nr:MULTISPECIES: AAA family ATPase [unclassified Clostridium]EKQ52413.1 MAG: hypothetical protein A370_04246 [Clostridium sp. Maddingley MBC34-26]
MQTILTKKLILKNFKGIKDLEIDFGNITNVFGENATGKTTIFDSFVGSYLGRIVKIEKTSK